MVPGHGEQYDQHRQRRQPQTQQVLLWFLLVCCVAALTVLVLATQLQSLSPSDSSASSEVARLARELPAACSSLLRDAEIAEDAPATLSRRRLYSAMAAAFDDQHSLGEHLHSLFEQCLQAHESADIRLISRPSPPLSFQVEGTSKALEWLTFSECLTLAC